MTKVGIFFGGRDNGNTAKIARKIQDGLGKGLATVHNVNNAKTEDVNKFDMLILGTAAWGIGEMHSDWENFIEELLNANLENKKIAIYGLGDQVMYPESFVDGMGTIFCRLPFKQNVVGYTATDSYKYYYSTAEKEGKFIGLAIDDDSQPELTDTRVSKWVSQVRKEFGL
ncbi:MAG: flavodoxin [Bacteroidetes bacterium]|nr:flavodoxin [Bacteroidota bacterium]